MLCSVLTEISRCPAHWLILKYLLSFAIWHVCWVYIHCSSYSYYTVYNIKKVHKERNILPPDWKRWFFSDVSDAVKCCNLTELICCLTHWLAHRHLSRQVMSFIYFVYVITFWLRKFILNLSFSVFNKDWSDYKIC